MTGVIKAGATSDVRLFAPAPYAADRPVATQAPAPTAAELALEEARAVIARLEARLEAAERKGHTDNALAYEKGLEAGRAEAVDRSDRRTALLAEAAEQALCLWSKGIDDLEKLAPILARDAVAKLFAPEADMADLVVRAVTARIARLRAGSVVALRASPEDFVDAALLAPTAGRHATVTLDPLLKSGEARIDLSLGGIDLSIERLASELDAFLRSLEKTA